jgi:glutathione S-transferase
LGLPVDEAAIAAAVPGAEICVTEVAHFLGDQPFMAGDAVSIADLMLAPHLVFLGDTPEGAPMIARHPNLKAWIDRMNGQPSMINTTRERLEVKAQAA